MKSSGQKQWDRRAFAEELATFRASMPMGWSVIDEVRGRRMSASGDRCSDVRADKAKEPASKE